MKRFEKGKAYAVNGGGHILVYKVTPCFVWFETIGEGLVCGRRMPAGMDLFGCGDFFWLPKTPPGGRPIDTIVLAGHEETDPETLRRLAHEMDNRLFPPGICSDGIDQTADEDLPGIVSDFIAIYRPGKGA